jgi:hypothetical protein
LAFFFNRNPSFLPGATKPKRRQKARGTLTRTQGKGRMTSKEILLMLLNQAHANGFEFRRWYQANISADWPGAEEAVSLLSTGGRFYSLVFSHEFARALWKKGAQMNFIVPTSTYSRMNGKGQVVTITRKPFTRRTIKADVWKYHLRQLALSNDPMRYLNRFVPTHEELNPQIQEAESLSAVS